MSFCIVFFVALIYFEICHKVIATEKPILYLANKGNIMVWICVWIHVRDTLKSCLTSVYIYIPKTIIASVKPEVCKMIDR